MPPSAPRKKTTPLQDLAKFRAATTPTSTPPHKIQACIRREFDLRTVAIIKNEVQSAIWQPSPPQNTPKTATGMEAPDSFGDGEAAGMGMEEDGDGFEIDDLFAYHHGDADFQPAAQGDDAAKPTHFGRTARHGGGIIPDELQLMKVVLPHHKMEEDWGRHVLEFVLPYDLALTTHMYLEYAYPLLNPDMEHTHLFLRPHMQGPMGTEHLSQLWADIQRKHAAPWEHFTPNSFRTVHVMDRVQHLAHAASQTGTNLIGDAAAMQNTAGKTWEKSYCKQGSYFNEMVKGTLDRMTSWRHEQLVDIHAQQQPPPPTEPDDGHLNLDVTRSAFAYDPDND